MNNFRKIVMISNANSTFTKGFIKNVLSKYKASVELISEKNQLFNDFYNENNIQVHAIRDRSLFSRIPFVRTIEYILKVCIQIKRAKPDLLLIHYAWPYLLLILPFLNLKCKIVVTYWGSDLFRASNRQLNLAKRCVNKVDSIVVLTEEMKTFFCDKYGWDYEKKLRIIDFGVSALSAIDSVENSSFKKSDIIGENYKDRIVITIGYNARVEQQHEYVTKALYQIKDENKRRIFLLYPMTYPDGQESYIDSISKLATALGFDYLILKDYMNEEEIAKLCVATDIFIHAQTTDSLSTSMIEQLYAGSYVINGEWLHYNFLDKHGIEYDKFKDQEELKNIVDQIVDNPQGKIEYNKISLRENCSWEQCADKWNELIELIG